MKKIILYTLILNALFLNAQVELEQPRPTELAPMETATVAKVEAVHDITMFPKIEGMVKNVLFLEVRPNESSYKVEFYAVKKAEVDQCNKHYLLGDFNLKNLEGYGYSYFVFKSNGELISTKMGCANDKKSMKNVVSGKTELVRYMSRLPLVVYTPEDIQIKYKIWKQNPKEIDAHVYH